MKTRTIQTKSSFSKKTGWGFLLVCGLLLSSYQSKACTASFTYSAGVNGHYTFTSTSIGVGAGTQYMWNPGDGSGWHVGRTPFVYTYTANATYTARLAIQDTSCVDTSAAVSITVTNVVSPCILSASFTYTVAPQGVVNFTSTSGGVNSYTQYYWTTTDSNNRVRATNTYTHQFAWSGYHTVWLTVEDTGSQYCIDSIPENIYVSTVDTAYCHTHANFTYTVGANGVVTFTSTSTGLIPGDNWQWEPGDTTAYGHTPNNYTHTYTFNGTYNVTLYIYTDSSSCYDSITLPVTVTTACNLVADFTETFDTGVNAGGVKFTSTSVGTNASTVYKWTFGDGSPTVTGDDTITHDYSFIGYYNVTLIDSNPGGCVDSVTKTIYVYNKDSLQACFTYYADSMTAGMYHFNAACSKGTDAYTYYKWTPGDGDPSDSGLGMTTYTHTYLLNGPYSATLTIWYTVLPHRAQLRVDPRYDLSTYTQVINVTTVTGIESLVDSKTYTIYPNPNNGFFNIAVTGAANAKNALVRISNMMGQVVYQANTDITGSKTIPVNLGANVANGIYLLQIITQDNTYTSRIAIQK